MPTYPHPFPKLAAASLVLGLGFGCQSTPAMVDASDASDASNVDADVQAPIDNGGHDTVLEYLIERYDVDGDGRVAEAEYGRDGGRFERLDRDHDGYVDEADYAGDEGREGMGARMGAQMVVFHYFDQDGDIEAVARAEVQDSFVAFDANDDGRLQRAEFESKAPDKFTGTDEEATMMKRMLGDKAPWSLLETGVDRNDDGELSSEELVAFFDDLDDGDGVWSRHGSRQHSSTSGTSSEPEGGAVTGTMAPDFRLSSPEGGEPVSLSSFSGDKPVALIFGSYT